MTQHKPQLYILSGPVRTGKTTAVKNLIDGKQAGGVLTPEKSSLRYLYEIISGNWIELEARNTQDFQDDVITIGRFRFLVSAMEKAKSIIRRDASSGCGTLIIDELGKLEMRGEGLEPAISEALALFRTPDNKNNLLIIIRESLLKDAIEKFELKEAEIIDTENLESIFNS